MISVVYAVNLVIVKASFIKSYIYMSAALSNDPLSITVRDSLFSKPITISTVKEYFDLLDQKIKLQYNKKPIELTEQERASHLSYAGTLLEQIIRKNSKALTMDSCVAIKRLCAGMDELSDKLLESVGQVGRFCEDLRQVFIAYNVGAHKLDGRYDRLTHPVFRDKIARPNRNVVKESADSALPTLLKAEILALYAKTRFALK